MDEEMDLWDSGEVGGFECFIEVDESGHGEEDNLAAAEVYGAQKDGGALPTALPAALFILSLPYIMHNCSCGLIYVPYFNISKYCIEYCIE